MKEQTLNITLSKKEISPSTGKVLPSLFTDSLLFKGDPESPFLAPRGVWIGNNKLVVADTGQNRVFIWNRIPTSTHQTPDVVLGQSTHTQTGRNASGGVTAASLHYPSGIWSDGQRLIVADAWNHRVLIWHTFPTTNGQDADVVLGQPDFNSNQPNVLGIGKDPQANTLNWPYGVTSDGKKLFVADTGNRRVLIYNDIPKQSFAEADDIIGKESFITRDYDTTDPVWPYSVKLSANGKIAITDTQYYRVLLWDSLDNAKNKKAQVVIGQADLSGNGQNQYQLFPNARTLNWCYDSCFIEDTLYVADTGNSRVLCFNPIPDQSNPGAQNLLGKSDFNTGSENLDTVFGTEKTMYWPFSLSHHSLSNTLAVADTGNHRIRLFTLKKNV